MTPAHSAYGALARDPLVDIVVRIGGPGARGREVPNADCAVGGGGGEAAAVVVE